MQTGMLIVCFAALIVAVVVSIRFSVNVGIVAYALAFLVGGFGLGLPANTIVGYFPVSLFFQLMVITLFYGFAVSNGTMQKIADNAVFLCRNRSALVPWVIFLVAFALCAIGCPPPGIGAALVALSVAVQKRTGMKYCIIWRSPSAPSAQWRAALCLSVFSAPSRRGSSSTSAARSPRRQRR